MILWDKLQALLLEIDSLDTQYQKEFIKNMFDTHRRENGKTPKDFSMEISEKHARWINWLYAKHIEGIERPEW